MTWALSNPSLGFNENSFIGFDVSEFDLPVIRDIDGYAMALGATFPIWGGEFQVSTYYADGDGNLYSPKNYDFAGVELDLKHYGIGVLHNYELSKRTSFYVGGGYSHQEANIKSQLIEVESDTFQVITGIVHNF